MALYRSHWKLTTLIHVLIFIERLNQGVKKYRQFHSHTEVAELNKITSTSIL